MIRILIVIFLFNSCLNESNTRNPKVVAKDSIFNNKPINVFSKDTIITYDIDGLSSEGCEAKAHYLIGNINDISVVCYSETGRFESTLVFLTKDEISVKEKTYKYKSVLTEVKTNSDIVLKDSFMYKVNIKGELLTVMENKGILNIYNDIKSKIPLTLY